MSLPAIISSPSRAYRGAVKAVIFDFAGTIVDFGSCAPVAAFQECFARGGVPISAAVARGPMGRNKRDHISEILYSPAVAEEWAKAHGGKAPTEADVDALYESFTPIQVEVVRRHADPIPGAVAAIAALRERGVKVGGDSGYNRPIMDAVLEEAGKKGLTVDAMECAGPANGRPKPWMATRVAEALDVFPLSACVKVDDTIPGLLEGLHAGMWVVGVAASGNELGLSLEEHDKLKAEDPAEFRRRLDAGRERMAAAGAHFVIDSVADILPVIDAINAAMGKGLSPFSQ